MMKFLLGALIGACAALLYAPQTGAATRAQIRDKANKLGHDLGDFTEKKGEHLSNKMKGYTHKMHQVADGLRRRAEKEMAGAGMDMKA